MNNFSNLLFTLRELVNVSFSCWSLRNLRLRSSVGLVFFSFMHFLFLAVNSKELNRGDSARKGTNGGWKRCFLCCTKGRYDWGLQELKWSSSSTAIFCNLAFPFKLIFCIWTELLLYLAFPVLTFFVCYELLECKILSII